MMRDEIDARMWNDSHDQFSEWVGEFMKAATSFRLPRIEIPGELIAAVTAFSLTLLTFGGTV